MFVIWWDIIFVSSLKGHLLCPFHKMLYKSQVSPGCVCGVSAHNTPQIIYYIILKMPILSGSVHVSLNVNELLLPAHFSRIWLFLYSSYLRYSAKKIICLVMIIMSIVLKSCVLKPYQFKLLIYGFLSAQKAWHVCNNQVLFHVLLRLSCHIHTSLCWKNTWATKTQPYMSVKINNWERNCIFILDWCIKWQKRNIQYLLLSTFKQ